jgi:HEAT repeat protein
MSTASVRELIQDLTHQDVSKRRDAARGLRDLADRARAAIPALIGALDDADSDVRSCAAAALGWIRIPEPAAIARLGQILTNVREQDDVRGVASSALGRLGEAALPHLLEAARNTDASGRQWAIAALRQAREAGAPMSMILPTLINAMNDPDLHVREFASFGLRDIGAPARAALRQMLQDGDLLSRIRAASALLQLNSSDKDALSLLKESAAHADLEARREAVDGLYFGAAHAESALPELIRALDDDDALIRIHAANCLEEMGKKCIPAVPALLKRLTDEEEEVRCTAAQAIMESGTKDASAVPALVTALSDEHPTVRFCVATALGKIGRKAAPALPSLKRLLNDEDEMTRDAAAAAIKRISR